MSKVQCILPGSSTPRVCEKAFEKSSMNLSMPEDDIRLWPFLALQEASIMIGTCLKNVHMPGEGVPL